VEISAALAVDLALLSEALDEPGLTIVDTVQQLSADVRLAVRSYLGMQVMAAGDGPAFTFAVMTDYAGTSEISSSLRIPLTRFQQIGGLSELTVILYAARGGAFVDLAADLAWLAGCDLSEFALDEQLTLDVAPAVRSLAADSVINQAIGVLFSRGLTPDQADLELDLRAVAAGTDRRSAAARILADVLAVIEDPEEDVS
jgi:hypothetical protein